MTAAPQSADVTSTIPWAKMLAHGWALAQLPRMGRTRVLFERTFSRCGKASVDGLNGGPRPSDACCWLGLPDAQAAPAPVWLA
jgi:hypothetical protein